jgi:hypothetical protein
MSAAKIHNGSSRKFDFDILTRSKNRPYSPGKACLAVFRNSDAITGGKQRLNTIMIVPHPNPQVNQPAGLEFIPESRDMWPKNLEPGRVAPVFSGWHDPALHIFGGITRLSQYRRELCLGGVVQVQH